MLGSVVTTISLWVVSFVQIIEAMFRPEYTDE